MPQHQQQPLTFTTTKGHTYAFLHTPAHPTRPTLLLIHGFPSHAADWQHQITHFSAQGYGILAPDLLGFGLSGKPDDVHSYRLRATSEDLVELLDFLGIGRVVGVGHDIGATVLSRLAGYYPDRFQGLVFLAVGPPRLDTRFDVRAVKAATREVLGYELLGYIEWLGGSSPGDAQETLERHPESAMGLLFAADETVWETSLRPVGAMERFVSGDQRVEVGAWFPPDLRAKHLEVFGRRDGYKGAVRWYQMWMESPFAPDEVGWEEARLEMPTVLVVPKGQGGEQQRQMLAEWTPKLRTVEVKGGHWVHLQGREEVNKAIEDLLASP